MTVKQFSLEQLQSKFFLSIDTDEKSVSIKNIECILSLFEYCADPKVESQIIEIVDIFAFFRQSQFRQCNNNTVHGFYFEIDSIDCKTHKFGNMVLDKEQIEFFMLRGFFETLFVNFEQLTTQQIRMVREFLNEFECSVFNP